MCVLGLPSCLMVKETMKEETLGQMMVNSWKASGTETTLRGFGFAASWKVVSLFQKHLPAVAALADSDRLRCEVEN